MNNIWQDAGFDGSCCDCSQVCYLLATLIHPNKVWLTNWEWTGWLSSAPPPRLSPYPCSVPRRVGCQHGSAWQRVGVSWPCNNKIILSSSSRHQISLREIWIQQKEKEEINKNFISNLPNQWDKGKKWLNLTSPMIRITTSWSNFFSPTYQCTAAANKNL